MLPLAGAVLNKEALAAAPIAASSAAESVTTAASFMAETNIFRRIGVEPVINCMGTS